MEKQSIILICVFIFALACLFLISKKMKEGFGNTNLKIYGITIIVFAGLALALSDSGSEKSAACYGILGAIGGYLFGIKES